MLKRALCVALAVVFVAGAGADDGERWTVERYTDPMTDWISNVAKSPFVNPIEGKDVEAAIFFRCIAPPGQAPGWGEPGIVLLRDSLSWKPDGVLFGMKENPGTGSFFGVSVRFDKGKVELISAFGGVKGNQEFWLMSEDPTAFNRAMIESSYMHLRTETKAAGRVTFTVPLRGSAEAYAECIKP